MTRLVPTDRIGWWLVLGGIITVIGGICWVVGYLEQAFEGWKD